MSDVTGRGRARKWIATDGHRVTQEVCWRLLLNSRIRPDALARPITDQNAVCQGTPCWSCTPLHLSQDRIWRAQGRECGYSAGKVT